MATSCGEEARPAGAGLAGSMEHRPLRLGDHLPAVAVEDLARVAGPAPLDRHAAFREQGGEQLLGQGDMLYSLGSGQMVRAHGPFVADEEVERIAEVLRRLGQPRYVEGITETPVGDDAGGEDSPDAEGDDDLYDKAVAIVMRDRKASTSYLQRRLAIGYNRAADLMERMERDGLIGPANNVGRREILVTGRDASPAAHGRAQSDR